MIRSYSLGQLKTEIPPDIRAFLIRALILFLCWKLVYHLVLFPIRTPDKQLTDITAISTAFLYRAVLNEPTVTYKENFTEVHFPKADLYIKGRKAIGIADPCNGLELFVLYVGFIFCLPTHWKRQTSFIVLGIAGIFIANCFRCLGLAWLIYHHYSIADFAHHYLFKMIIYGMIFYAWIIYSKKYFVNVG